MWDFFSYLNISICIGIIGYLFISLTFRGIAESHSISPFVPILKPTQSRLLIVGFILWTFALILEVTYPPPRSVYARLVNIFHPAILTAATMYLAHSMMIFSSLSTRKNQIPNELDKINIYRIISIAILIMMVTYSVILGDQYRIYERLFLSFYMIWQLIILTHVFSVVQSSNHILQKPLTILLIIWGVNVPAEIFKVSLVTTVTLTGYLLIILRANHLYLSETLRRANSFKTEKDVMISFLSKLSSGDDLSSTSIQDNETDFEDEISFLGGFDLDRLLQIMLDYGMELCNATAGAIFIRDDIHELFSKTQKAPDKGIFFSARAVSGLYPPTFEMGHFPYSPDRVDRIHDVVRSEKLPMGEGIIGEVAQTGKSVLIPKTEKNPQIQQQHEEYLKITSILAVPLKLLDQTIAVLSLINKSGTQKEFTHQDEATLIAVSVQAANALGSAIMHRNLQEKERLQREIELAREVQRLLLPKTCPEIKGYQIAARSVPAQDVGGDYYDFLWLDKERLAVVIADVSGKGIPGALTMATVRSALRAISTQNKSAREILIDLNQFILPDMRKGMFVSMLLGIVNIRTGEMEIVRAGHEPLLVFRKDKPSYESCIPAGIALGVINGELFASNTQQDVVRLQEGDKLVLYTDGITEAMNAAMQEFTFDRFIKVLDECRNLSAEETVHRISDRIASFSGKKSQHDDLTLVVLQRI